MMDINKVTPIEKLKHINEYWNPHIAGELNGQYVKLAKLKGEFVWHKHDDEDELFYVLSGKLVIELRDKNMVIEEGEYVIIPRGVEHKPVAEEEVHVMLFEPKSTLNTGDVENELTRKNLNNI
ncbi:MAG: cupin domain-containing protein [Chitinophagaceae bacterium]|nr:cupin domain-containing protein [Chitinophagaceae bacterium]